MVEIGHYCCFASCEEELERILGVNFLLVCSMQILEQKKQDFSPRISFRRSRSLSCPIPCLHIDSLSRKSFSYNKLPQEPLKLTVIKLDGTSFEIEVAKTGTVAQMKQAVEAAFFHLPKKGPKKVSWSFVWGHFCLCYDGQKLLTDTDDIGNYGIKDGDKLQFIRHISISYNMVKERSGEEDPDLDEPTVSACFRDRQLNTEKDIDYIHRDIENRQGVCDDDEDRGLITNCRYKLVHLFRVWFSYRKLPSSDVKMEEKTISSRLSFSSLGSFKDVRTYTTKYDSQRETQKTIMYVPPGSSNA